MNFTPQTNIKLAKLTTMQIGGTARYFTRITSTTELLEALNWAKLQSLPHLVLGGGSNTVFDDGTYDGLVIKIDIKGFEKIKESSREVWVRVGSGENWDKTVHRIVGLGLSGIEALSGIPGSCGAAPVQNIGAYGQEVKNSLEAVEVYDTVERSMKALQQSECQLNYRDSIFKSSQKDRYIITAIVLRLSKNPPKIPQYKDLIEYFTRANQTAPSLKEIRSAVIEIRSSKFADPNKAPNAGSFFKNPIVSRQKADRLKVEFPDIRIFDMDNDKFKVFAGWLIEKAGLKGKQLGNVRVDPNHALVLENINDASQKELWELITTIQEEVQAQFDITLEPEPVIIKF